jgi:hypothetical protein
MRLIKADQLSAAKSKELSGTDGALLVVSSLYAWKDDGKAHPHLLGARVIYIWILHNPSSYRMCAQMPHRIPQTM